MASRDMSLREISDRIRIGDLLVRYTVAVDTGDWELLDTCFKPDAHCDYTSAGGVEGRYPDVRRWLEKALAPFAMTRHVITNTSVRLDGDEARARTYVINPMGIRRDDGSLRIFTVGATYHDHLVHTEGGWRIAERVLEVAYTEGDLSAPPESTR